MAQLTVQFLANWPSTSMSAVKSKRFWRPKDLTQELYLREPTAYWSAQLSAVRLSLMMPRFHSSGVYRNSKMLLSGSRLVRLSYVLERY